jgi:hypothetical protein
MNKQRKHHGPAVEESFRVSVGPVETDLVLTDPDMATLRRAPDAGAALKALVDLALKQISLVAGEEAEQGVERISGDLKMRQNKSRETRFRAVRQYARYWLTQVRPEERAQLETQLAPLFEEMFGNPFRAGPPDLAWRTGPVLSLARSMTQTRDFSAMPILADALEEAGCSDAAVLGHCRASCQHARWCWVLHLLLSGTVG